MGYCIYKISSDDCDYVYVGSTKNLTKRKCQHKSDCNIESNKNFNYKLYQTIRENGGWDNWRMVVIEELGDITKREAEMREEYWRQNLKAELNCKKCYCAENKKDYDKKYYEENKEKINNQNKEWHVVNRDKILEIMKEYRKQNRDKLLEQKKEKITCECGCVPTKTNLARHKNSAKHQAWEWRQTALRDN